jgi:hypothetical protein
MSLTGNKIPIGCTPKQKAGATETDNQIKQGDPDYVPLVDDMDDTNATPPDSGLFHTFAQLPNLSFKSAMNETVIQSSDSYIVLGTDRPGSKASGYGALGSCAANSIDLVVGRGSSLNKGKGPAHGTILDNLFVSDAARINISQLTNIDLNFGLAPSSEQKAHGNSMPRSGIGIKADDIRIIGRHSIKIITGKSSGFTGLPAKGEENSLGGKEHQPAPTIELIAGNHIETRTVFGGVENPVKEFNTLQRAAMGDSLREGLQELVGIVGELWSATFNFILTETVYDGVVGVDPLRHWVPSAAIPDQVLKADYVLNSLWQTKLNLLLWSQNHLEPHGYRYICSSNVKLT